MSIVLVGSTSGSVTLQEPAVAGTTVLTLPAVSGTVLTTGSSGQSIPKAALPTGSVLQVVSSVINSSFSTTNQFNTNSTLFVNITPLYSSSRILVLCTASFGYTQSGNCNFGQALWRDGVSGTQIGSGTINQAGGVNQQAMNGALSAIDTPNTTSQISYYLSLTTQIGVGGTATVREGATIIAMEIAA